MVEDTQKRYADDITLQELVRLRVENERLREALRRIGEGDTCVSLMSHPPICKRAYDARSALQQKESE